MWRQYFPLLCVGLGIFVAISRAIKRSGNERNVLWFYNLTGILLIAFVHGWDILWLYGISLVNFLFARIFKGSRWNPALCWIWNAAMLFLSDYYVGFKGTFKFLGLSFLVGCFIATAKHLIQENHGLFSWHVYFKMSMLRHLSYSMDYYWMCRKKPVKDLTGRSAYTVLQESHQPASRYLEIPSELML